MAKRFVDKAQEAKGRVKETSGKAIGNKVLEAQGKADQLKAQTKQVGTGRIKWAQGHDFGPNDQKNSEPCR